MNQRTFLDKKRTFFYLVLATTIVPLQLEGRVSSGKLIRLRLISYMMEVIGLDQQAGETETNIQEREDRLT